MATDAPLKVLFIDDDEGFLLSIKSGLGKAIRPEIAVGAMKGLARFAEQDTPEWDVVIFDYQMPGGINGIDVLRSIRAKDPYVGTILLTGYPSSVLAADATALGCDRYLIKTPPLNELQEAIREVAQRVEKRRETKQLRRLKNDSQVLRNLNAATHSMVDDLSELIVSLSHDCELLSRNIAPGDPEETRKLIERFTKGGHALISQWRSFSGPLADIDQFNLVDTLKAACAESPFSGAIKLNIRCDGGDFPVNGISYVMHQALREVLQNAMEARAKTVTFTSTDWAQGFILDNDGRSMEPKELHKVKHGSYSSKPDGHVGGGLPFIRMVFQAHGFQPSYQPLPGGGGVRLHATRRLVL